MGKHFTVTLAIHEVTPPDKHLERREERQVDEVVKVTTRGRTKQEAMEKAIRMLEAEAEGDNDGGT